MLLKTNKKKTILLRNFPCGPVAKTPHSQCRGPAIQSLVRELDPTGPNQRSHMPQLKLDTAKYETKQTNQKNSRKTKKTIAHINLQ